MTFTVRILKIALYSLALLFAAYSVFWYINAKANLRYVQNWLNHAAQNPYVEALTYDQVKLEGYPFTIQVVIKNPNVDVNLQAIAGQIGPEFHQMLSTLTYQAGTMHFSTKDKVIIQTDVIGSHYRFLPKGELHYGFKAKGKTLKINEKSDEYVLDIRLDPKETALKYRNLETLLSDAALKAHQDNQYAIFKKACLKSINTHSVDPVSGKTLIKGEKVNYVFEREVTGPSLHALTLHLEMKNVEMTKAYDDFMNQFMPGLNFHYADHGLINSAITFHYSGASNAITFAKERPPVEMDLGVKFDSNLYHVNNQTHLKGDFENKKNTFKLELQGDTLFKPGSQPHLVLLLQDFVQTLKSKLDWASRQPQGPKPVFPSTWEYVEKHIQDLPTLSELGKIEYQFDLDAINEGLALLLDQITFKVSNQIYAWGIDGHLTHTLMNPMPEGELQLQFEHLDALGARIQSYLDLIKGLYKPNEGRPGYLEADFLPKLKALIRELSDETDPKGDQLKVNIKFSNKPPFGEIKKMPMNEIMPKLSAIFSPKALEEEKRD